MGRWRYAATLCAVIALTAVTTGLLHSGTAAAFAPGALAVTAAPTSISRSAPEAVARVANTGDGPVHDAFVQVTAPAGASVLLSAGGGAVQPGPVRLGDLAPGESTLVTLTVTGVTPARTSAIVIRVEGRSDTGRTAATASVELAGVAAPVTLTISGTTRLTDRSPADLVVIVSNETDTVARVILRADAGRNPTRMALTEPDVRSAGSTLELAALAAHASVPVYLQVHAGKQLRRGRTAVVVRASVQPAQAAAPTNTPPAANATPPANTIPPASALPANTPSTAGTPPPTSSAAPGLDGAATDVTATRELDVEFAASDLLPGGVGVGSVLAIPGLVFVWVWLAVRQRDRRLLGLPAPSAGTVLWNNKLWLLLAVLVSLAVAFGYAGLGFADLLDSPTWYDIAVVSAFAGAAAAVGSWLQLRWHRSRVPSLENARPLDVLRAAARADNHVSRTIYTTPDSKRGLFVHRDRDAVALTPPIRYSRPDAVNDHIDEGREDLRGAVAAIDAAIESAIDAPAGGGAGRNETAAGGGAGSRASAGTTGGGGRAATAAARAAARTAAESDVWEASFRADESWIGAPILVTDARPTGHGRLLDYELPAP